VGVGRVDMRTGTEEAFHSKSNNGSNDKPSIFGVARVRPARLTGTAEVQSTVVF
jgi:hypothetical protein